MRKRMNYLAVMAAVMLLALTACNEEAALTLPAEPQNPPVADNSGNVYITGDDFTWELGGGSEGDDGGASSIHAVTRTQLTVEGNVAKFTWTPGDRVGILPDEGAQVWFEIPTPAEGEEPTNVATFDGGAWALKPTSDYAAYYPFVKDFDLDRTKVPVSYTGQAQTGNGTTAHLGAYDYQGARPSTTNGAGGVSFDFDHVGALVLLRFTVPTSGTRLTGVTLSADGAEFTTKGTYDLTSAEGFPITPTETAESMTIGLDYTTTADDETVTLYFLCAPIDLSGKTVNVSVACSGTEGETIEFEADGKNLLAAGGYLMEATVRESLSPNYLTFSADAEQTLTVNLKGSYTLDESLQYSVGEGLWTQLTAGTPIIFGGNHGALRLRGKSSGGMAEGTYNNYSYISFANSSVPVACSGDIRTLVDYNKYLTVSTVNARFWSMFSGCTNLTTVPDLPATTLADRCYNSMFSGCTNLVTAPELPATTLADGCYSSMFSGCTNLVTAPELPATKMTDYCYSYMFSGCTSLATAPELPATTLAYCCYGDMFSGCTNLTIAPELPATILADYCYQRMFSFCSSLNTAPELPAITLGDGCYWEMFFNCTSLAIAPELPATTLKDWCYYSMFYNCPSLTTAPELPATTLAKSCYESMFCGCALTTAPVLPATTLAEHCYCNMFEGCSSLSSITMLATDINPANLFLYHWVNGVSSSGTFYKNSEATWTTTGTSGIPTGWTVQDYTPAGE